MNRIVVCILCVMLHIARVVGAECVSESEKAELLKIHKEDRRIHFETDVDALIFRSPEVFISVTGGKINKIPREDERKFFEQYFKNARYYEWDDLEPPIIRVSCDGTMGWTIVRIKVRREQNDQGKTTERSFIYAGIMTYEKREGKWIRVANVSTFE